MNILTLIADLAPDAYKIYQKAKEMGVDGLTFGELAELLKAFNELIIKELLDDLGVEDKLNDTISITEYVGLSLDQLKEQLRVLELKDKVLIPAKAE